MSSGLDEGEDETDTGVGSEMQSCAVVNARRESDTRRQDVGMTRAVRATDTIQGVRVGWARVLSRFDREMLQLTTVGEVRAVLGAGRDNARE